MIYKNSYNSPLGEIYLESDGEYLTGLLFTQSKDISKSNTGAVYKDLPIFDTTKQWLDIYFSGNNPDFIPPFKINNITPFRQIVTDIMLQIPYGKTISYKDIATKIANIKEISKMSAQAVGGAVGANPICIIIPCHRVIGANGTMIGYGGGIDNKIKLLEIEKK